MNVCKLSIEWQRVLNSALQHSEWRERKKSEGLLSYKFPETITDDLPFQLAGFDAEGCPGNHEARVGHNRRNASIAWYEIVIMRTFRSCCHAIWKMGPPQVCGLWKKATYSGLHWVFVRNSTFGTEEPKYSESDSYSSRADLRLRRFFSPTDGKQRK